MTVIDQNTGVTHKPVQLQSNFERRAFMFMRLSGIALLILAVGHMIIQHVLNSSANLTIQFAAVQWNSWGWRVYDILLLWLAIPHGVNGLRLILGDYIHGETAVKWIGRLLLVFVVATVIWASWAMLNFDSTPFLD